MKNILTNHRGFSFVELITVVAIIGIMSVATTVGFGTLRETLVLNETAGVIQDLVKRAELEVLRGDYEKVTIHFNEHYLVIDQEVEGATLSLSYAPDILNTPAGSLTKKARTGEILSIDTVDGILPIDVSSFEAAAQQEWEYTLQSGSDTSNVIRLTHFNINREDQNLRLTVDQTGGPYTLEIEAPYAKKIYTENSTVVNGFTITLDDGENTKDLTLGT